MRRWVSLGGWCGPALMLSKLGISPVAEALPFDAVRSTFDGIVHLTRHGFTRSSGFLPGPLASRPFVMDPVGVWLLFRSTHACFTHVDLNRDDVLDALRARMQAWDRLLSPRPRLSLYTGSQQTPSLPVTFLRTVVAENAVEELNLLPTFHAAVRERTQGTLPFRTVMVVHDQAPSTRPLFTFGEESAKFGSPCVVWNLKRALPPIDAPAERVSLLDQCHDGYQEIITAMSKEMRWRALEAALPASLEAYARQVAPQTAHGGDGDAAPDLSTLFKPYTSLSLIKGVPAFRGTCKGFGSTLSALAGKCVYCGSEDGHAMDITQFDTHKPWADADVDRLLLAYALHDGDEVAATETAAREQGRGAHETYQKLCELVGDAGAADEGDQ